MQGPGKRSDWGVRAQTPERDQTGESTLKTREEIRLCGVGQGPGEEISLGRVCQRPEKRSDWRESARVPKKRSNQEVCSADLH